MHYKQRDDQMTIKDVAKMAGVSIATVSRILNGKDNVSPALAKKVYSAIEQLQYRPNAVAKALKRSESHSIGLIIPDIENPYFPALVRGAEDAANMFNYAVFLCNTDGQQEREEKYINFLLEKRVDGILYTSSVESGKSIDLLETLSIPVVLLDRQVDVKLDKVVTDNWLGAFWIVEHLIREGRKAIAFISGPCKVSTSEERLAGYKDALARYDIPFDPCRTLEGNFTFESGWQAAARLIDCGVGFDAIFAANDMMAFGAIELLEKKGVIVPEDVAVAGYDDIRMAAWYKPALTTVRQPVYVMGQQAVRLLIERKEDRHAPYKERRLRPELIVRASSVRQPSNKTYLGG